VGLLFLSRFCICIAALLSTSSIKPAFSQERKINIAYVGPSLIALPFLAAQEWKLFSQNGLSTQLVVMTFTISIPRYPPSRFEYLGGVGPATVKRHLERNSRARGLVLFRQGPLVIDGATPDEDSE